MLDKIQNRILEVFDNVSSENPLTISDVCKSMGDIDIKILIETMESLYKESLLNTYIITKEGVTTQLWWCTGIVTNYKADLTIARKKAGFRPRSKKIKLRKTIWDDDYT